VVLGGGINVSYDLSPALSWPETYLRAGAGYLVGRQGGQGTTVDLIPLDLAFEKGFYLGSTLLWYSALGASSTIVSVDVFDGRPAQKLSATVYGALARTGLDILLSPDFSLRLEAAFRLSFSRAEYETEDDAAPVANGFERRDDRFSAALGNLAINWML
jgi:hypothetical protein